MQRRPAPWLVYALLAVLILASWVFFGGDQPASQPVSAATNTPPVPTLAAADKPKPAETPAVPAEPLPPGLYAEITTPHGLITAELFFQRTPLTVANFAGLAEGKLGPRPGKPFYDGLVFHRIVPGFVAQGGDPIGNGTDGPGYFFADEIVAGLRPDAAGMLAMANDGPDTNGSQFFLTLAPAPHLNYLHTIFGRVVRGLDLLDKIEMADKMTVKIVRVGEAAEKFADDQAAFDQLAAAAKKYAGPAAPGPTAFCDDPAQLLQVFPPRAQNFNYQLANFARATGRKVFLRLAARAPPDATGPKLTAAVAALAAELGLGPNDALVYYTAETQEWRLWEGSALPAVKEEAVFAETKKILDEPTQPAPRQLKLACDAVLEALLPALEPK